MLINTHEAWKALRTISPATCILSQLGDIHPYHDGPVIQAHTVVLDNCDKNFVFYWLNSRTFPYMNTLVLNSHPCEPSIVRWIARRSHMRTLVHENRYSYINRWCRDVKTEASQIQPISDAEYRKLLTKLLENQHLYHTKD
ncbi:MAG: hypothetical protein H0X02_08520 [Nitrosomonas sp.]|nr:hypothetical protein [Nitrosomonas sp.]